MYSEYESVPCDRAYADSVVGDYAFRVYAGGKCGRARRSVVTRSWIRVTAITMPTRHAVSTLKGCPAATGLYFMAAHNIFSTEVSGTAHTVHASLSLHPRSAL